MNFFKSVFADDDDPPLENQPSSTSNSPQSPSSSSQPQPQPQPQSQPPEPEPEPEPETQIPTWGFVGGLIKTFATKSESVIETYRRDLQEFSSGLKMETQVLKEVASSSLEVGASKAQVSLESVGQAIDTFGSVVWKSTSQIINQGNDSDLENPDSNLGYTNSVTNANVNSPVGKYSRYDAQLRGIQCDVNTYVEEFEDVGDFEKWRLGLNLEEKREEMENLMKENGTMEGIYKRVVPNVVDHDVFWFRYYYRVHKLEQAESVRAKLVERANEDEELSWEVDDEEEEQQKVKDGNVKEDKKKKEEMKNGDSVQEKEIVKEDDLGDKGSNEEAKLGGKEEEEEMTKKSVDERAPSEVSKDSDVSVVSSQPSYREEEEEGEDLGNDDDGDEKKGKQSEGGSGSSSSPGKREELRKRLSVAEDDEDLIWDIEDDDEPIKKS